MLTQDEKKRTGQELRKNYEISELTPERKWKSTISVFKIK